MDSTGTVVLNIGLDRLERVSKMRFVSGHDFSRAEKGRKNNGF
jgi:hypothetical protein